MAPVLGCSVERAATLCTALCNEVRAEGGKTTKHRQFGGFL